MRKTKWDSIKHFFSRSIRRDTAAEWEYRSIVKIKPNGGCTGFWVENSRNRALMITARHCFNWDITSACNGSFKVYTAYGEYEYAHCKQVIAAANNLDIALVEMEITSNAYHRATLGLAKSDLTMILA